MNAASRHSTTTMGSRRAGCHASSHARYLAAWEQGIAHSGSPSVTRPAVDPRELDDANEHLDPLQLVPARDARTQDPMSNREFKLVSGYVRGVDRLPRLASDLELTRRCALVLDSYRPSEADPFFDAELYALFVRAARTVVHADVALAELPSGTRVDVTERDALLAKLGSLAEREPFLAVRFLCGSETVALALYEPFVNIGGPEPYHDSYTAPLYTREDVSQALAAATFREAESLGARGELIRGNDVPDPEGLTSRLAAKLRQLFQGPDRE